MFNSGAVIFLPVYIINKRNKQFHVKKIGSFGMVHQNDNFYFRYLIQIFANLLAIRQKTLPSGFSNKTKA